MEKAVFEKKVKSNGLEESESITTLVHKNSFESKLESMFIKTPSMFQFQHVCNTLHLLIP